MNLAERFGNEAPLIGMVHLLPLPGAPRYDGSREAISERARADAEALREGGVDALLVENFGDAPFYPEAVPAHVVADMTAVARDLAVDVDCPLGINVLRNDARAALSVAAAAGGSFVRVNVHAGARVSDQGLLEGRAHETLRLRERLDADVAILADVAVKHSAPAAEREIGAVVADLVERGLADGLVVSGQATGHAVAGEHLDAVLSAREDVAPDLPVFVGSGVTPGNVADLLDRADGAIVGSSLKQGGEATEPVDADRVRALVAPARER
jgi:membrane complex biogenesis BtpA family protein